MTKKVHYETLLPLEFQQRLAQRPVGYLPVGTLEWHGPQNALGADFIQARGLFQRAAERFGGIVLPPLWLGPDRIKCRPDGPDLLGMDIADSTTPNRQLPGSCYWVPRGLFLMLVESILAQCVRAGFKCIVMDGHGPSRGAVGEMAASWEKQFGISLIVPAIEFKEQWKSQKDHAGRNETSIMMAVAPELVDLGQLPADRATRPVGVGGEDPRDSSAEFGNQCIQASLTLLGQRLEELVPV